MRMSPLFLALTAFGCVAAVGASAQDATSPSTDQATAPQPTDKEAKALDHCKAMTAQQRAQSSKCTDLMKKFGISEREQDPMSKGFGH